MRRRIYEQDWNSVISKIILSEGKRIREAKDGEKWATLETVAYITSPKDWRNLDYTRLVMLAFA